MLVCCATQMEKKNTITFWCTGWQTGGIHSWWISFPECRVASLGLGKVQYYSSSGNSKDGPSKSSPGDAPSAEDVLSAAAKASQSTPASSGDKLVIDVAFCVQLYCACYCSLFSLLKLFHFMSCQNKLQEIVLLSWDVVENSVSQKKLNVVYSSDLIYVLS